MTHATTVALAGVLVIVGVLALACGRNASAAVALAASAILVRLCL